MNTPDRTLPTILEVTMPLTPEITGALTSTSELELMKQLTIDSPEAAEMVSGEVQRIKARFKVVEALRKGFLEPAKLIVERANALFKPALDDLTAAEAHGKGLLAFWHGKETQRINAENAAQAEISRKARQKADAEAAEAHAKAKAIADAKLEAARKAEEEGDAAKAAKLRTQADNAIETGTVKATAAQPEAAAIPVAVVAAPAKTAGFSMRDNWIAELDGEEQSAKREIINTIASGRSELLSLLSVDMSAANKLAKALKGDFNVPGLKARNVPLLPVAGSLHGNV